MGIAKNLKNNVVEYGVLTMVIVIVSLILLKFKTSNVGNAVCGAYYNETLDKCCVSSALCNAGNQSDLLTTGSTINTIVTALQEPKNWVAIVIIAAIGLGLIALFARKKNS